MQIINIHDAKTHFSRLIEAVAAGEEIIIARAGKPAARLVAFETTAVVRQPGSLKGRMRIADDFDHPLPESMLDAFEGR